MAKSEAERRLDAQLRTADDETLHEWVSVLAHKQALQPDLFSKTDEVTRRRIETTIRRRARVKHRAARPGREHIS